MKYFNLGARYFTDVMNTTSNVSAEMTTLFHKRLIMLAGPQKRYGALASKFDIPLNSGKVVNVRIPAKASAKLSTLTEGVNPDGSALSITAVTATLGLYGDVIKLSSFFESTAFDNVFKIAFDTMAEEAGITIDTVDRNAAMEGTNVIYASTWSGTTPTAVTSRDALDNTAVFTFDLAFKAAAMLGANDAPKFDGYYAAVIHPLVKYDLQVNQHLSFNDVVKYTTPDRIFKGEIGELGGIRFVESSIAKVYKPASFTVSAQVTTTTAVGVDEAISADAATALAGAVVYVGGTKNTIASATAGAAGAAALTLGSAVSAAKGAKIAFPAVFATLVCGKDAFMSSTLEGEGNPFKMITKSDAQAGGPLEMFSTVGWRAAHAAVKTVDAYMVRIESGCTLGDTITAAN